MNPAIRLLALTVLSLGGLATGAPGLAREPESTTAPVAIDLDRLLALGDLSDPRVSPEGDWIAYVVERADPEEDERRSRIWRVPAGGGPAVAVTAEAESSAHPRWSPDGNHLAFISARDDAPAQVWRLPRAGGEAEALTDTAQDVKAFEWSPDSTRLLLELQDPTPAQVEAKAQGEAYEEKAPPPWVIDRLQFKEDYVGYLDRRRTHLYVLDIATRELRPITTGDYDHSAGAWSPDGTRVAFTSNRSADPDRNYNTDIWVASADPRHAGQLPVQVTTGTGADESPAWSPDGRWIVHTSVTDPGAIVYATSHLAVSSSAGGATRVLTGELDRMIFQPRFAPDGRYLWFLLEDGGEQNLARIRPDGRGLERMVSGRDTVFAFDFGPGAEMAVAVSRPEQPLEIFGFDGRRLEQRTFTHRGELQGIELGTVEAVRFTSRDGTPIEGFVVKPPGFVPGRRYPAILDIHGGPQLQYDWSFSSEAQHLAAHGYLVIRPNPRGSTGYGQAFCQAIWQDWGGPDYEDVMAAVDDAIGRGWADPQRLGVMGWSYGGILTNNVIVKTDRFKAAISGASEVLYVTNYGHDHYQRWWEGELGLPWEPEARAIYERLSPFNQVERIVTPTLVLGGAQDWNVPIINSEQLYLALKRRGIDTQLVVYPDQYHSIDRPSYRKDLYQRHIDWFKARL